ncbi:LCCL domain-containing protein (CCp1), partial [Plasmodium ovale curtisi]
FKNEIKCMKYINITQSVSLEENKDYENCEDDDLNCRSKTCILCCEQNGVADSDDIEEVSFHKSKDIQKEETIECQFQCKTDWFTSHDNFSY